MESVCIVNRSYGVGLCRKTSLFGVSIYSQQVSWDHSQQVSMESASIASRSYRVGLYSQKVSAESVSIVNRSMGSIFIANRSLWGRFL